jgi:hypothetical protein
MTETAADIERIVREVLAQMGVARSECANEAARLIDGKNGGKAEVAPGSLLTPDPSPARGKGTKGPHPGPLPEGEGSNEFIVTARVVTLASLPEKFNGVRKLVVSPCAILTPSVRDELQLRGVTVEHRKTAPACAPAGRVRLVVAASGTTLDPIALASVLEGQTAAAQTHRFDCLIAATDKLAAELATAGTLVVLVTPHTAAALCLANRLPGVRAVLGVEAEAVGADADAVGANLLVLSPAAGFFRLKQMAGRFLEGGPRACPSVFGKRLK